MNLFLTEDGVLKLGYYGLTTQAECYSTKETDCEGVRSFAPEVFEGEYEIKSDVWSLGIVMLVLIGIRPYYGNDNGNLPTLNGGLRLPFGVDDIESSKMADFLEKCFQKYDSWSVNELLNVSVMGWRMMSSIHLWRRMKKKC